MAPASASINTNSEVSFSETQVIPAGVTVNGVKVTRDFSTYWDSSTNGAIAYVYLNLNGVAVGQLGFVATGTNNAYTSVSTEFFGPLPSYIPGSVNTWTIGSLWNPVNLANIKIQVFYADASTPAIAVNGTEDTPLNFTAVNFTNAYGDIENSSLASITIVTLPATGTLKLISSNVSAGQVITLADLPNLTYVPATNENGIKTFTVTASDGSASSSPASTVSMNIAAVNDAPVANGSATLAAVNEDIGSDAPGATVASLFDANFSDPQDNPANTFTGVAVSSYTVDSAKGNWQYSSNGSTWSNLVSATSSAAITLKATDYLRFVPAANYNGQATALSANLIETGGALITSGATVNLSGGNVQINLSPANVIGGSATYGGTFNTGGFNATLVLDKQTGTIGNESSQTGYWLGPDATGSNYFVIDLGASVVIKKLEFFNTHNSFYNDRGTLTFHIDASNAIVNSGGFNLSGETTILTGTLAAASDPIIGEVFSLSSNSQSYRYLRFTADAVRNNGLNEIRIFGPAEAVVGGSTVYSQNTVSLNHTIIAVNDAPNVYRITAKYCAAWIISLPLIGEFLNPKLLLPLRMWIVPRYLTTLF